MKLELYQIDAFAEKVFQGNPAGVCPLKEWLSDELMLKIANENNLSETAFYIPTERGFHIRWFTPAYEVDLCGHATLASAFVIFNYTDYHKEEIIFTSRSGDLIVRKNGDFLQMDFPSQPPVKSEVPEYLAEGLKKSPEAVLKNADYIAVFKTEDDIINLAPDFEIIKKINIRGICATAPGKETDFVSRFFAPGAGINEDPVTGSSHCELTPYWSKRLNKNKLSAQQLSQRGGKLECELSGNRVLISGKAVKYMQGTIEI